MTLTSDLYYSLGISDIIDTLISTIEPNVIHELNTWATHNLKPAPLSNYTKLPPTGNIATVLPILKQLDSEIKGVSDAEITKLAHELKTFHSDPEPIIRRFSTRTTIDDIDVDLPKVGAEDKFVQPFNIQEKHGYHFSNVSETPNYAGEFFEKSSSDGFRQIITPARSSCVYQSHKTNPNDKLHRQNGYNFSPFSNVDSFQRQNNVCLTPDDVKWLESCKGTSQRIFRNEIYSTPKGYNYPIIDSRPYTPIHHS